MLSTGHAQIDSDHARMIALFRGFSTALVNENMVAAKKILQNGIIICLEHWKLEETLLAHTGWRRPIIQCHLDDHNRIEGIIVRTLIDIAAGRPIPTKNLDSFENEVVWHIATFDTQLAETLLHKQTDRFTRNP